MITQRVEKKKKLTATVDCMEAFVKATNNLEGDGFLALVVYDV